MDMKEVGGLQRITFPLRLNVVQIGVQWGSHITRVINNSLYFGEANFMPKIILKFKEVCFYIFINELIVHFKTLDYDNLIC
jgi:hypothetical protein